MGIGRGDSGRSRRQILQWTAADQALRRRHRGRRFGAAMAGLAGHATEQVVMIEGDRREQRQLRVSHMTGGTDANAMLAFGT